MYGTEDMIITRDGPNMPTLEYGLRLAATPVAEGGWKEWFSESDYADLRIQDDFLRANTAIVLENAKQWLARLCRTRVNESGQRVVNEVTRAALVGGFSDYIFPIIRAGFPVNPINDLVSVQPTTRRTATVVYWSWVIGKGKGSYQQGQKLFDPLTGKQDAGFNFSNEYVDREVIFTGTGATATATGTLEFHLGGGVRPGSVRVTAVVGGTPETAHDNANGGFFNAVSGSIDYSTGALSVEFSGNIDAATSVIATYQFDSEGATNMPEVDVQITTSTVETQRRALKLNYPIEAMQDVMAEIGVNLENSLLTGAAEQMNFEISRQLVHEMWSVAPVVASFPISQPPAPGFNQQDHFKDLSYVLTRASNTVWSKTLKVYPNWMVVDEGAANVIESLPAGMFEEAKRPDNVNGMHFIGVLNGRYNVYKDPHLDKEPGASATGNILMGHKGNQFHEAGLVYSPYQLMYTTETLTTADFISQKGLASRYATKLVNPNLYVRVNLDA